MNSKLITVGGLWKNKAKDGKTYLSGNWGNNIKILIFPNDKKDKDPTYKGPDYSFCLAPIEKKEQVTPQGDAWEDEQ